MRGARGLCVLSMSDGCGYVCGCGCLVLVVQGNGRTPLISASQNGHVEAVRTLLDAGAAVNQDDVSGDGGTRACCVVWLRAARAVRVSVASSEICLCVWGCV